MGNHNVNNFGKISEKDEIANRSIFDEVDCFLTILWSNIGIDKPSGHDAIIDYIANDVRESADPVNWTTEDVRIGFRRFLECMFNRHCG